MAYLPRVRLLSGEVTPDAGSSDLSASLVSLSVINKYSSGRYCPEDVLGSHAPCPAQIGVRVQSDLIPDHGSLMRQQVDVGHVRDRAMPVSVAVIPPDFLDEGSALLCSKEDPP